MKSPRPLTMALEAHRPAGNRLEPPPCNPSPLVACPKSCSGAAALTDASRQARIAGRRECAGHRSSPTRPWRRSASPRGSCDALDCRRTRGRVYDGFKGEPKAADIDGAAALARDTGRRRSSASAAARRSTLRSSLRPAPSRASRAEAYQLVRDAAARRTACRSSPFRPPPAPARK